MQETFELRAVELTGWRLEVRVGQNLRHDVGHRNADPHAAAELIEPGLRDQLGQHLPIDPQRGRLLGRNWTPELLTELLQAFVIGLAELVLLDFGVADLGEVGCAVALKNIVDPPNRETAGKDRQDDGHEDAAEPIFGGFTNPSKHKFQLGQVKNIALPKQGRRIIRMVALRRNRLN